MKLTGFHSFVFILIFSFTEFSEGRLKIICQGKKENIFCKGNRVLNIVSATYGRTNLHTCRSGPIGTMNCGSRDNALRKTKSMCQGKKKCKIFSSNTVFQDPCPGTSVYLTVDYTCVCSWKSFKCKTVDKCIQQNMVCNGKKNCPDGSDEANCPTKKPGNCKKNKFACANQNQCIPIKKRCNGKPDCRDGSDEIGCECKSNQFTCQNGQCIALGKKCDGRQDCSDRSDEQGCECKSNQFTCQNGQCIALGKKCDGRQDCSDRSDEQGCECKSNQFTCQNGQCIALGKKCDGRQDCSDRSDEQGCKCKSNQFTCQNGQCIALGKKCDGRQDCSDRSDEQGCGCPSNQFTCQNRQCIALGKKCDGRTDCSDGSDEQGCPPSTHTCGVQAIQPIYERPDCPVFKVWRIVGGCAVRPAHSWPWVLQLQFDLENNGVFIHECGAALISESYAITASHCFLSSKDAKRWKIVAGRHKKSGPEPYHQIRKISKIIPFPNPLNDDYNPLDRDLTLIKLENPVTFTKYVSPVCLPPREPGVNDVCIVAGWGEVEDSGDGDLLKNTIMPIVGTDRCNGSDALRDQITKYMFCAGFQGGKHDACQGDSGGPLMCKINNVWVVSGLVSWGIECAKAEMPGVYANVYRFVDWINTQMSLN